MDGQIVRVTPENYAQCGNVWDMERQSALAKRCYEEIVAGRRAAYAFVTGGAFVGEISLVFDMSDTDYVIPGRRVCLSRLIVKPEFQRRANGAAFRVGALRIHMKAPLPANGEGRRVMFNGIFRAVRRHFFGFSQMSQSILLPIP